MKHFEINALGLEEIQEKDIDSISGGGFLRDYFTSKLIDATIEAIIDGFKDGTYSDWYSAMYKNNPIYCPLR